MKIEIRYSCGACGLKDVAVDVPARDSDEDVLLWMDATGLLLGRDHHERSPHCQPKMLQDVKIPIAGADWVGGPPVQ